MSPKQLAEYLQLSQRTVYRLLERGDLPAVRVGGQWRFRKSAVDEWLDVNVQRLDADSLRALEGDDETGAPIPSVADLLTIDNALLDVPPDSGEAVIRTFVGRVHFPEPVSPDEVAQRVIERERLCSTAMAGGAALLHTARTRRRLLQAHDLVAIGRIAEPVAFGAVDGSPTDVLFLVLARSERVQLALLAALTRMCQEPGFLGRVRSAPDVAHVITLVRDTAARLFAPAV